MERWSIILVVLVRSAVTNGYSNGAPFEACKYLAPQHENTSTQTSPSPYYFRVSEADVSEATTADAIRVTIYGEEVFTGFLIQAVSSDGKNVGQFESSGLYLTGPCQKDDDLNNIGFSSATHISPAHKWNRTLLWNSDGFTGEACFRGSVTKNHDIYWTGIVSDCFTVKRATLENSTSADVENSASSGVPNFTTGDMDDVEMSTPSAVENSPLNDVTNFPTKNMDGVETSTPSAVENSPLNDVTSSTADKDDVKTSTPSAVETSHSSGVDNSLSSFMDMNTLNPVGNSTLNRSETHLAQ